MPSTLDSDNPFVDWLQSELDARQWNIAALARRMAALEGVEEDSADFVRRSNSHTSVITKVMRRERSIGPDVARRVADALGRDQIRVFRMAGLLTDEEIEDVKEDEAARKIRRLLAALDPDERERAVRLLEQYVKDHKPAPARKPRIAPTEA